MFGYLYLAAGTLRRKINTRRHAFIKIFFIVHHFLDATHNFQIRT